MFVFDVYSFSKKIICLQVDRNEEFLPLKNALPSLVDSPHSCRRGISNLHKKWILSSGGSFLNDSEEFDCEISPLLSYFGEGLESLVKGKKFSLPLHLKESSDK